MLSEELKNKYQLVVGLEVHAQLSTKSKIFAGDAVVFGGDPNTSVSVVSLAHPGTLPKLNKKAVEFAIRMGLACHCEISRFNIFDRKNYFYPDIPKGYQISQYKYPIVSGGRLADMDITRIHLEEDTARMQHAGRQLFGRHIGRSKTKNIRVANRLRAEARAEKQAQRQDGVRPRTDLEEQVRPAGLMSLDGVDDDELAGFGRGVLELLFDVAAAGKPGPVPRRSRPQCALPAAHARIPEEHGSRGDHHAGR